MGARSKLIEVRERRGLTRQELADRLGISRQYVLRVERGERHPKHKTMVRWADALKTSMDKFREDDESQPRDAA